MEYDSNDLWRINDTNEGTLGNSKIGGPTSQHIYDFQYIGIQYSNRNAAKILLDLENVQAN